MITEEQVIALVNQNVLTGGNRTTAAGLRAAINEAMAMLIDRRENGQIQKGLDDKYYRIKPDANGVWQVVSEIGSVLP